MNNRCKLNSYIVLVVRCTQAQTITSRRRQNTHTNAKRHASVLTKVNRELRSNKIFIHNNVCYFVRIWYGMVFISYFSSSFMYLNNMITSCKFCLVFVKISLFYFEFPFFSFSNLHPTIELQFFAIFYVFFFFFATSIPMGSFSWLPALLYLYLLIIFSFLLVFLSIAKFFFETSISFSVFLANYFFLEKNCNRADPSVVFIFLESLTRNNHKFHFVLTFIG